MKVGFTHRVRTETDLVDRFGEVDVYRAALDQLDRASTGIVLCIAEGAGRRSGPDKRRF